MKRKIDQLALALDIIAGPTRRRLAHWRDADTPDNPDPLLWSYGAACSPGRGRKGHSDAWRRVQTVELKGGYL